MKAETSNIQHPTFNIQWRRLAFALLLITLHASRFTLSAGPTPFYGKFYNADGSAQTNVIQMQAWPPANNWTIYGTNMVYGGAIMNLVPDATGYFSNAAYANTYRLLLTNLNSGFYMTLLDTTNFLSIAVYATDTPTVGNILNGFGLVTNWLGYTPAPATYAGISNALAFQVATNSNSSLSNTLSASFAIYSPATYVSISNALGFAAATNSNAGIVFALGYTPPTNSYSAFTNIAGVFATNGGPLSLSQITAALTYTPATNTAAGLRSTLGYQPATNPVIVLNTNLLFTASGVTNTMYITNGFPQRISTP